MTDDRELLEGGVANAGAVVRIGDEVHRPANPNSPTIHRFLRHLRDRGFGGASEPIGIEGDREVVGFVPGDVAIPPYPQWAQADTALASTARLIRRLHDASVGFASDAATWSDEMADTTVDPASPGDAVICHNDVCLENVVFRDGIAVALLDFDFAAPGRRTHDLACFARMCVPIDDDASASRLGWEPADRPRRLRVAADAYGLDASGRAALLERLDATIATGGQFVLRRVQAGDAPFVEMWDAMGGMERFDRRRSWWAAHRADFATALG